MAIGARMPPHKTAPASHGRSAPVSGVSRRAAGDPLLFCDAQAPLTSHATARLLPLPRYSRPASNRGCTSATNSFASGADTPNRAAAASARKA